MLSKQSRIANLERALELYAEREKEAPDPKRRQTMTLCRNMLEKLRPSASAKESEQPMSHNTKEFDLAYKWLTENIDDRMWDIPRAKNLESLLIQQREDGEKYMREVLTSEMADEILKVQDVYPPKP